MREIEFRAWLKDEKKMIDVKAIDWDENGDIFSINYPSGKAYSGYDKDNIELMQWTSIKDRNGVKIFEGDIVITYRLNTDKYLEDRTREYDEFIGVITWNEEYLEYYIQKNTQEYEDVLKPFERHYEVIGNIYENPELLGE